ncbi:hypothetical protein YP76_26415 [Sphingobium chungbukense]|uniref:Uncharacterized protein n=1 Tax=Sphingobium chungbukense TaxID=56193 RepID=A0A0M3AL38_9SPHN|nr:hypothetical protein YP76_26415 [Sphingobium chungbukense]
MQPQPAANLDRAPGLGEAGKGGRFSARNTDSVEANPVDCQVRQGKPISTKRLKFSDTGLHHLDIVPPEAFGRCAEPVEQGFASGDGSRGGKTT